MRIGVDIDDVLFPFWDNAHRACVKAGITNGVTPSCWRPYEDYGCSPQDWFDALEVATLNGSLYGGKPIAGSIEALHQMQDTGHQIHLVTARGYFRYSDLIKRATVAWLETWLVPHDSLHFTQDKTLVRVDVAVDDRPENVTALEASGIPAWLVRAPHNGHAHHHQMVDSLEEFAAIAASWETVS